MSGENASGAGARIGAWVAALLWTGLVLTASGEAFSADNTRGVVFELWAWLGIERSDAAPYVFWTRKAAHFVEYAILAFLVLRALGLGGLGMQAAAGYTLLWALAVAIGDEANQAQLPSRTGSARDVVIDMSGASAAVFATTFLRLRRRGG